MSRVSLLVALILVLPGSALAQTPTDDVYRKADITTGGPGGPKTTAGNSSEIPFTGLDVAIVALAGVAVLGTGIAIRRASRLD
jgi:hypothetical protein